jgi:uncharacterized damage-inducible protein DinB
MNAEGFRQLYEYHFAANRRLWEHFIAPLTADQFRQKLPYSLGSVRNQVVHMLNIDDRWFCGLRGVEVPGILNPVYFGTAAKVRARWDTVEEGMRGYLERLDELELARQFDKESNVYVWQVLFHVLNHGTDHRAQALSMLAQLGVEGFSQDYYLYLLGKV